MQKNTYPFVETPYIHQPMPITSPGLLLGISGVLLIVFRRGSWSHGSFQGLGLQFMGVLSKARGPKGPRSPGPNPWEKVGGKDDPPLLNGEEP